MRSPDKLLEDKSKLTFNEITRIKGVIAELEEVINNPEITETRLNNISSALTEIRSLRETYIIRIMNLMKAGYVFD